MCLVLILVMCPGSTAVAAHAFDAAALGNARRQHSVKAAVGRTVELS